jgi:hypothetical protein
MLLGAGDESVADRAQKVSQIKMVKVKNGFMARS